MNRVTGTSHTGITLAAETGATLKELMSRMGHSSTRAALIYLHATSERDRKIADDLSEKITAARKGGSKGTRRKPGEGASGADLVRDGELAHISDGPRSARLPLTWTRSGT